MGKLGEKVKAVYLTLGAYDISPLNDGVKVFSQPLFKFDNDSVY